MTTPLECRRTASPSQPRESVGSWSSQVRWSGHVEVDLAVERVEMRSGGNVVVGGETVALGSGEVTNVVVEADAAVSVETALRIVECTVSL